MATRTRFEGTTNLRDIAAVKVAASLMSNAQLSFYFKVTKDPTFQDAHAIFFDEMADRCVIEYRNRYGV